MNRIKFAKLLCSDEELLHITGAGSVVDHMADVKREKPRLSGIEERVVIAMEELSELEKELSKFLRGGSEREGIIEELADVIIVLDNLQRIFNISDTTMGRAVEIKLHEYAKKNMLEYADFTEED